MLRVLAVTDYFLPGTNAGGPVRTLINLAAQLAGEVEVSILTRDRDAGERAPYPGVQADAWTECRGLPVHYLSPRAAGMAGLRRVIGARPHDVLYLNSTLSALTRRALALRRLGLLPRRPVVVAPRGELAAGPLAMKRKRKALYLAAARAAGLFRGVSWQATSDLERDEIRAAFPGARVEVVPNLSLPGAPGAAEPPPKQAGRARFVYLSRVTPSKNLLGALDALAAAPGEAVLDVYGNLEDADYWERCRSAAEALPPNVRVEYRGKVAYEAVEDTLAGYHFLILPTVGENFGHVVVESLRAGLPVLISDRTPWRGLTAARAGWDVPLHDLAAFRARVRECVEMDGEAYRDWSAGARRYADRAAPAEATRERALQLFRRAAASGSVRRAVELDAVSSRAG